MSEFNNPWFYQPLNTQRFMRGFDKFAFPSVDAAMAYIETLSADEQSRLKIYKRDFSLGFCVIHDPATHHVIGKKHWLVGYETGWIQKFAVSEN